MPFAVIWSRRARQSLAGIQRFVAADKPIAAERLVVRIIAIVEILRDHPLLGHSVGESGMRALVISRTPYIAVYRIRAGKVIVLNIWHGAQNRED